MTRPAEPSELIRRFTAAERWIHRTTAALMGTALVTAAFLYLPALAELIGRRSLLVTVHEWAGVTVPVPLLAGLVSRAFRADLVRLNRFGPHDRGWLRATLRRRPHRSGKFNAGQKLYAAVISGAVLVMIGTGLIMWFPRLTPLFLRTGATFVHDWLALLIGALVCGHIWMASKDPDARTGLRTGLVSRSWARRHHPLWEGEQPGEHQPTPTAGSVRTAAENDVGPLD
ncbi:cytochrome b/b6 domain-containing protein [Streptomyces sp. NBC_00365]|uniref:cytochrome b/b6 domain-containing protein n=1 Tax=Streptomyces sp. NBC_00365 TaxID=2975726 RepID=UPI002251D65E|nr:cytochrome b/b6 domain-containing protein [Streptomyces sp. NBC_00365]MCX5093935.1 cytochrome b/b6 domain-containing protein [Streptomyces sp. NBC_00365]